MAVKGWRVLVGAVVLGALAVSACSSSSSSGKSSSGTPTTAAVDLSVLGPVKHATGAPLKIGYIYAGQAQSTDNTNEITIAQGDREVRQRTPRRRRGPAGRDSSSAKTT